MKKALTYLALAALILLTPGCAKSELEDPAPEKNPDAPMDDLVQVDLRLELEPLKTPTSGNQSRVIASQTIGATLVEMIEEPYTRVDQDVIENIWIMQYESDAPTARLVFKRYYPNYFYFSHSISATFELKAGIAQRVVVVGNTFDENWGDAHVVGTSTYKQLQEASMATAPDLSGIFSNGGNNMYILGSRVGDIEKTEPFTIIVIHNVALIEFGVKLGTGPNAITNGSNWTIQLKNIPDRSHYYPNNDLDDKIQFPATVSTFDLPPVPLTGLNTTTLTTLNWTVPVNRRGTVPQATPKTRTKKAPAGATTIVIKGERPASTITFTLALGHDFNTDFNIRPGYSYKYRVTLSDDPTGEDSQVSSVQHGYVGMFDGPLLKFGNEYFFPRPLYVDVEDALPDTRQWDDGTYIDTSNAGNVFDGFTNTWFLTGGKTFSHEITSALACFDKNNPTPTSLGDPNFKFYMPAETQLAAICALKDHIPNITPFKDEWYFSSTDDGGIRTVSFTNNNIYNVAKDESYGLIRCCRRY